ncbi:MAG: DinB family protein [Candidatus Thorarchaeota archaeon]
MKLIQLTKDNELTPRVAEFFSFMNEARQYLLKMISDVDNIMLDFTPNERTVETIGTLLLHIAGVEWSWIIADIEGKVIPFEKWKYAYALSNDVNLPQLIGKGIKYYLEILAQVREEVYVKLKEFTDDDLDRIVKIEGKKFTIEWILYHVIEHEAVHIGQISLLKRLYKIENK